MNVVVFEDAAVAQLGDLVVARPACDLTLGSHTLVEALGHLGHVRRAVRPHLAAHLAGGETEPACGLDVVIPYHDASFVDVTELVC